MAILIEAVSYPGSTEEYFQGKAREDTLYTLLSVIKGYKVTRINKVKGIKHVRERCGVDLKTAKDVVDGILGETL